MQAVIQTGGHQYVVEKGHLLVVEKLAGEKGSKVVFDQVLLINGDRVQVGTPLIAGASVEAKIIDQNKGEKVVSRVYKRRKGYHKTKGHRQQLTRVEITGIVA
ncbi:MAG: 50S ribosomal protein L21 [uncultured bacterium]|nr:MAG: 50S ribosomal protein L21 [uncultured bacterium]